MIVAFPIKNTANSAVSCCYKGIHEYDHFGSGMLNTVIEPDITPIAINTNTTPESDEISEIKADYITSNANIVHLAHRSSAALKRKTVADLWATIAIPANDNLRLMAD